MSYYHIINIKMDKKNNSISADLADSCWEPSRWVHLKDLCDKETFEEKYANLMYNLISGNYHPSLNTRYSRLVMNPYLKNYCDDVHDIGELKTYYKYKEVIIGIINDDYDKCVVLKSERELYPNRYYKLTPIKIKVNQYGGNYYTNEKGELYCYKQGKLYFCDSTNKDYGYPLYVPLDVKKYFEINGFLKCSNNIETNKQSNNIEKEIEYEFE